MPTQLLITASANLSGALSFTPPLLCTLRRPLPHLLPSGLSPGTLSSPDMLIATNPLANSLSELYRCTILCVALSFPASLLSLHTTRWGEPPHSRIHPNSMIETP
jgi:hypothetical protein